MDYHMEVAAVAEIDEVRIAQESNYQTSLKLLGDTVSVAQDVVELYKLLLDLTRKSPARAKNEVAVAYHFVMACHYQIAIGCLNALRGHLNDGLKDTRQAIELGAFAARIKRHPEFASLWMDAAQGEDAYEAYRKKFSGAKIFPEDHALLKELGDRYDHAAKLSHPSIHSLAGRSKTTRTEDGYNITFDYFQLKNNDPAEPTRTFLWIVDTHLKILLLFQETLAEGIAHDKMVWDLHLNGFEAKLAVHKKKWKDIIFPPSAPALGHMIEL
jgi:hypothetical protein